MTGLGNTQAPLKAHGDFHHPEGRREKESVFLSLPESQDDDGCREQEGDDEKETNESLHSIHEISVFSLLKTSYFLQ